MAGLSKITTVVGQGGLGRRAPNEDKISGIVFYNDVLPSGFLTTDRIKEVFTLQQAEDLGIIEGSSDHSVEWYHISEFFRIQPEGTLFISFNAVPVSTYDFLEVDLMAVFSAGKIRNYAVYNANDEIYATTQVTTLQSVMDTIDGKGFYASAIYGADISAVVDLTTIGDLRVLVARKVSVCVGQDGGGAGKALFDTKAFSITAIGAQLGAMSRSSVQQSIGNPANFNMSNGVELETIAIANGDAADDTTILASLKDDGYTVLRKYLPQIAGSYFERVPTAVVATSDFAFIENNRVIDKAIRLTESILTPQLQKDLLLNPDGTLTTDTVGFFQDLVADQLSGMESDGEISGFNVLIDPDQDVLATSTVVITIEILPVGIAEFITVNIGLVTNL